MGKEGGQWQHQFKDYLLLKIRMVQVKKNMNFIKGGDQINFHIHV